MLQPVIIKARANSKLTTKMTTAEIAAKPNYYLVPNVSFLIGTVVHRTSCTALTAHGTMHTSLLNHPFTLITDWAVLLNIKCCFVSWAYTHSFIFFAYVLIILLLEKGTCNYFLVIRREAWIKWKFCNNLVGCIYSWIW